MPAAKPSLRWLYLAVLGPLVLLAVLAWWGTNSQIKAAWSDARQAAGQIAPELSKTIPQKLEAALITIPQYPDPPVPGAATAADQVLDSSNLKSLAQLRDDANAGLSPAGLPRRALAALRIHQLEPETQSFDQLVQILVHDAPSVLSTPALHKLWTTDAIEDWGYAEGARDIARLIEPKESKWLISDTWQNSPAICFVRNIEGSVQYLKGETFAETISDHNMGLPRGIRLDLLPPGRNERIPPETVALAPMSGLGKQLLLSLSISRDALEYPIIRQQKWTFALLAAALLTALIALIVIHRTVARERHLADLKSQFVASVSHELRAPLGSIRLMAEALQQEKVRKPAEFHTLIAKEGARLSHLIENVLDFARIEEGRKYYHFEECDLSALLRDTLRLMQPLAEERRVHLAFDIPDLTATVDPNALQQALVNLVDNAIKFSPEGSAVDLRATITDDQKTIITITDHGPGIAKSEQRNIFNRFHRLGNELRRETQGTGIGLSIVKHIAEAHHGTITVESTPPNGSTFTLTLPAQTPDN